MQELQNGVRQNESKPRWHLGAFAASVGDRRRCHSVNSRIRPWRMDRDGVVLRTLSPLDSIMGAMSFTIVTILPPPKPSRDAAYDLERVHAALITTIEEDYPTVIGTLHVNHESGVVSVMQTPRHRAEGANAIRFVSATCHELVTQDAVDHLPFSFIVPRKREEGELMTVKVTVLSDGGLALGVDATHALLDGQAMFMFFNVWGMHYRSLSKSDRPVIHHDRDLLSPRGVGAKLEHPEFMSPTRNAPEFPSEEVSRQQEPPKTTQKVFHLSPNQLQKLKRTVCDRVPAGEYVSTIDTVTALFLLLVTQARGHEQDVRITTGVNGRNRFDPPVPANYAGNCIFNAYSSYRKEELAVVSPDTLCTIARRVRASILRHDEAYMRDAIEYVAQPGAKWIDMGPGINFFLGSDVMFTSWANVGMYDADFGAGNALYTGPPTVPLCDGLVIIMDAINGASGLDVLAFLECSAMETLVDAFRSTCMEMLG